LTYTSRGSEKYDVTPVGKQFYEWMKQQEGEPLERLDEEVRSLLHSPGFRDRHAAAFERWSEAEANVWGVDKEAEYTAIGHACRESIQLFVTDLVEHHRPVEVNPDPAKTVDRLKAVMRKVQLSESVEKVAVALLEYFGALSDLVMRQEHGAQKEGENLQWEDTRRVVFLTGS
jgi:hypothetical protein